MAKHRRHKRTQNASVGDDLVGERRLNAVGVQDLPALRLQHVQRFVNVAGDDIWTTTGSDESQFGIGHWRRRNETRRENAGTHASVQPEQSPARKLKVGIELELGYEPKAARKSKRHVRRRVSLSISEQNRFRRKREW